MRVTGLFVKNLLGVQEMRLEPGQLTVISGKNGTGKSSVLTAFQAALQGGNLCNLARVGAEDEPEVVLVLDEGRYRIERKGDDTVVKERVGATAAYEKVRRPQQWLDGLYDQALTNPMRLLQAKPGEFRDILLEVLPIDLDRAALLAAIGNVWPGEKVLPEAHPLEVLAFARTTLFDERTGVNRSQRDKQSSAYELSKNIPAELPEDPAGELAKAAQARDTLFKKLSDRRATAETAAEHALALARGAYDQEQARVEGEFKTVAAKLRAELARKVALLTAETETAIQAERDKGQEALAAADELLESAEATAAQARQKAHAEVEAMRPDLDAANARVGELNALSKNVAQLQESKRLADKFERESEALKEVSERLTKALDAVDVFKAQLLAGLPIEGLEFRGKEIFIGGVPFEQVNTAAKIRLAVKVAVLRANTRPLPLIWVDGAEALDPEQFELLEDELVASGVQAVVARVDDGPLKVETREGEPAKVSRMAPRTEKRQKAALVE